MNQAERKRLQKLAAAAEEYARATARTNFASFLCTVDSGYRMQWFHKLVADRIQRLADGEARRLMVFIPPQHGKSEMISRKLPAWLLGRDPETKIACCSYSASLSTSFGRQVQRLMASDEYRAIFPAGALPMAGRSRDGRTRTAAMFETGHAGFYKAVGVGGSLTGTPVDIAIIDDPVKDAAQAYSPTYRANVWDWYNAVLSTRLHNESRQLFIMTRWHEDDLAGRILKAEPEGWDVLRIPAICEQDGDGLGSPRHTGDPLWPERHSLAKLEEQRSRSPREFSALYQQQPAVGGGDLVKRSWFVRITQREFEARRTREPVHFYIDTAYGKQKAGRDNDPTGIMAASMIGGQMYILHAANVWLEMPELLKFLPEYVRRHGGDGRSRVCIEPKANGLSVLQLLRANTALNIMPTPTPTEDKATRLSVASPKIECGRVGVVEGAWTEDFLNEVCGFPAMPHDEFVDILVYGINDLFGHADAAGLARGLAGGGRLF